MDHPKVFCPYCMHGFDKRHTNDQKMKNHMNDCFTYGAQKTNMPEEGKNIIEFNDIAKQKKLPFCIYADTECILTKVENGKKKNSTKTHKHEISGYGYSVVSPFYPTVYKDFRGKDAGEKLLTNLLMEGSNLTKKIKEANKPMKFGELEKKVFMEATQCHICEKPLEDDINGRMDHLTNIQQWLQILNLDLRKIPSEKEAKKAMKEYHHIKFTWNNIPVLNFTKKTKNKAEIKVGDKTKTVKMSELKKTDKYQEFVDANVALTDYIKKNDCRVVRDHCHFTGEFRGAAHNHCNRQFRKAFKIPVFFHNMKGYDGHILFSNLAKLKLKNPPKVIAQSLEKFMSIKLGTLEFKDSLEFLNSSLEKLVKNLKDKGLKEDKSIKDTFPSTYAYFKKDWNHIDENAFELLTRKGVYPYEYMNSWEKMNETKLPSKEDYFSQLTGKGISEKDYDFAHKLYNSFKLKNLGELHDLYMGSDVNLLADVFEAFREFNLKHYKLDPAHFLTAPSLSWSACLKYTGVKLELSTDPNMNALLDQGLIGGISFIGNQYARANNPDLGDHFDNGKPKSYIFMVDCNNQYGWAMSQFLPTGGFKWIKEDDSTDEEDKTVQEWVDFITAQKDEL